MTQERAPLAGAAVAVVAALGLVLVAAVALYSAGGQRIDETALRGARIGRGHVIDGALTVLGLVSVAGLALATCAVAVVAFSRRRADLAAVAVAVVVGANLTTQVLKHAVLDRPDLGIDTLTLNSLPSGHSTVAASLAVALVLVVPAGVQSTVALFGAATTALTGAATLAAGWHRPSDVLAAFLVVGLWLGLASVALSFVRHRAGRRIGAAPRRPTPAVALLVALGSIAAAVGAVAIWRTIGLDRVAEERFDLLLAYGGGAAAIAGGACWLLAAALWLAPRDRFPSGGSTEASLSDPEPATWTRPPAPGR